MTGRSQLGIATLAAVASSALLPSAQHVPDTTSDWRAATALTAGPAASRSGPLDLSGVLSGVEIFLNVDEPVAPSALGSDVSLIYFWGTYCAPCIQKIPLLNELGKVDGLTVIAVTNEPASKVTRFVAPETAENRRIAVIVGTGADRVFTAFNIRAVPSAAMFGPDGQLIKLWEVRESAEEFASRVKGIAEEYRDTSSVPSVVLEQGAASAPIVSLDSPRPSEAQAVSAEAFSAWAGEVATRVRKEGVPLSAADLQRYAEFHALNRPTNEWRGDEEVRHEVMLSWGRLFELAASAEPAIRADTLAIARAWLSPESPHYEPSADLRRSFVFVCADFAISWQEGDKSGVVDLLQGALLSEKDPLTRVSIRRAEDMLTVGITPIPPSLLASAAVSRERDKLSLRFFEITAGFKDSPSIEALNDLFALGSEGTLAHPTNNAESIARRDLLLASIAEITSEGTTRLPLELQAHLQRRLAQLSIQDAGHDQLLDHRYLFRLTQIGLDGLPESEATHFAAHLAEQQRRYTGRPRGELWWSLETAKERLSERLSAMSVSVEHDASDCSP